MADERKIGVVEIDRLYDFLDGLEASGYTIDPRQYLALSDLLMTLIARGDSLDELPLKTLIAPLICSSPAEQHDFYQRFERWYPTLLPVKQASLSGDGITLPSQPKRRWSLPTVNRTAVIWVTVVVAVIALIVWLISNSAATGTPVLNNTVSLYGVIFAVFGFIVWVGWRASILYQENQYITRELANQEPVYTKVPVKAYIQDVMPVMQFKPIVSALRRRTQVPSSEVDVDRTIETALNRNNWLEIVYRQRQVMPEYVVLIDRKSRLDQQARFVQEVLTKLEADGVWLHQYEFSGDPRICFPVDRKDTPLRLKDLQSRHPDTRLLIFSGSNELLNPLTGLLQDWLESLSYWQERAILTPDKMQKVLLEELEAQDFAVLPMTFDGLAALVRAFEADNVPLLTNGGEGLPAQLTERPMRWTGRDVPPEAEVKTLVEDVKNYLGKNGFYWLCATAIYPELRWELTLHLGSALKDAREQSLLNPDLLICLARLPWFRFGYMPDWVRHSLVDSFTSEQESYTRDVLGEMLATAYDGKGFDLRFASKTKDTFKMRSHKFFNALFRNMQPENIYGDYIFTRFILNSKNQRISIKLPQTLRHILRKTSLSSISRFTTIRTTLGTFSATMLQTIRWKRYDPPSSNPENTAKAPLVVHETQDYLDPLIDSSLDGIFVVDKNGNITYYNEGAERICGYNREEILGQHVGKLYGDTESPQAINNILLKQQKLNNYKTVLYTKNGQEIPITLSATLLKDKDGNFIGSVGYFNDGSVVTKASDLSIELLWAQMAIKGLPADLPEILRLVADGVIKVLNCDLVTLYTYNEAKDELALSVISGQMYHPNSSNIMKFVSKNSVVWHVLETGRPYFVENINQDPLMDLDPRLGVGPFFKRERTASFACAPLIKGNDRVGILLASYRSSHLFSEQERSIIQSFATYAAIAIKNEKEGIQLEAGDNFQKRLENSERHLLQYRTEVSRQLVSYRIAAIISALVGLTIIAVGIFRNFFNNISLGILSAMAGVIPEVISYLFFARADQASKQADQINEELQEIHAQIEKQRREGAGLMVAPKEDRGLQSDEASEPSNVQTEAPEIKIVDGKARIILIGNREERLAPQPFALFQYLYLNANKVCTTDELLKNVLAGKYEKGYLPTLIGRIRKTIEDDPEHPHLLITEPNIGYRLNVKSLSLTNQQSADLHKNPYKNSVLIVDNDQDHLNKLKGILEIEFNVSSANDLEHALQIIQRQKSPFQVVVTDLRLLDDTDQNDESGLSLLKEIKKRRDNTQTILLASSPTYESALKALRKGRDGSLAFDYIDKRSLNPEEFRSVVRKAAEQFDREIEEKAELEAAEKAAREKAERESFEKAKLEAEEVARQKATREKAEREAVEKAAREKAEREIAERNEQARLERERQPNIPNYRRSTSRSNKDSLYETEIALWGPSGSGKDWLINGFAKELEYFNQKDPDFLYELYDDENNPISPWLPKIISPTIDPEDYILKFTRRPSSPNPDRAHLISAHSHNINIHNDRGASTVASLLDSKNYERTFQTITNTGHIIVTLDSTTVSPRSSQNNDRAANTNLEDQADEFINEDKLPLIARKTIHTAAEYTQLVQYLLLALAKNPDRKRYLAICLTKMDKKTIRGNPWDLLRRLFGQNMYDLLNNYRQIFEIEVFATSAIGFVKVKNNVGRRASNEKNGQLIDPSTWQPVNTAAPFFWIFENIEKEMIDKQKGFFKNDLKYYINYPIRDS